MRSATAPIVLAVAAAALVSCHTITEDLPSHPSPVQVGGPGSIPVIVIPVPEQTPLPVVPSPSSPIAPSPNPRPTATPDSGGGGGEPPVTDTSPVLKLNPHVYFIERDGAPAPGSGGAASAPAGCRLPSHCTARHP